MRRTTTVVALLAIASALALGSCSSSGTSESERCVSSAGAEVCVDGSAVSGTGLQEGSTIKVLVAFVPAGGSDYGNNGGEISVGADGKASGSIESPSTRLGTNTYTISGTAADGTPVAGDIVGKD